MIGFNVRGEIFELEEQFAYLSDYLRVLTEDNFYTPKDEEGRYILDLDPDAFESYIYYLEGRDFKLNEKIMDIFDLMGLHNTMDYPFGYWKNKLVDDHIKDNWKIFSKYVLQLETLPIKNKFEPQENIGEYYIVGDFVLYMAGINKGFRNMHIISEKPSTYTYSFPSEYIIDMYESSNWGKSPFTNKPNIIRETLDSRSLEEICYSGICDADMIVYSGKDKKIYCTKRGWNALKRREIWFEPDKLHNTKHADRLVALKSQGFKIKLPYREKISINGIDSDNQPQIKQDIMEANEGGDIDEDDILLSSPDQLTTINGIIYFNSVSFMAYNSIPTTPLNRIIATTNGVIFRFPDEYMRDIGYIRKDEDITDIYLQSKYLDRRSIIGDTSIFQYRYEQYITNRTYYTPDSFGFKDYPSLYRDIVYLNNSNKDDLINLGTLQSELYIEKEYINAGPGVLIELLGLNPSRYNLYNVVFDVTNDNRKYNDYMRERDAGKTFHTRLADGDYYYYWLHADKKTSLRDAVKYSKIDLEQIAYNPGDGCVYCSILFLYAYCNNVHTFTKNTRYNVLNRLVSYHNKDLTFFAPNLHDVGDEYVNSYTDALLQLALYEGDMKFKEESNVIIDEEDLDILEADLSYLQEDMVDKARTRAIEYLKSGKAIFQLPDYVGKGLKYKSHREYSPSLLMNELNEGYISSTFLYPLDYYDTLGSQDHQLQDV